ncbi:hypothetical protein [Microbacterium sp. 1.5R]|nr:hypothetical protein [Microbacterium sp. 1.5R]
MSAELAELKALQLDALRKQLEAAQDLVAFYRQQYQDALREQTR